MQIVICNNEQRIFTTEHTRGVAKMQPKNLYVLHTKMAESIRQETEAEIY